MPSPTLPPTCGGAPQRLGGTLYKVGKSGRGLNTRRVPAELWYILLVFALFVLPQGLQRLRIPTAVTSLALGAGAGMGFGLFSGDHTIWLLSVFGIVSLF